VSSLPCERVYEPFSSNDRTDTYTDTQPDFEGFIKNASKEGQVPMDYVTTFKGISSSILQLMVK
jgi:hypothetical protein